MKTLPGGLTLNAQGKPQNANGEPLDASKVPAFDGLSRTIGSLEKRAAAIEAKQPVQRIVLADPAQFAAQTTSADAPSDGAKKAGKAKAPAPSTQPAQTTTEKALADHTVDELKQLAADEQIDLGEATLKADIVAAIEKGREAK